MNRIILGVFTLVMALALILSAGCSSTADTTTTPLPSSYKWETRTVLLEALTVKVIIGDKTFAPISVLLTYEKPTPDSTTLEVKWYEDNIDMRIFFSFQKDGSSWWADLIRTHDGQDPPDWVDYTGKYFDQPLGVTYQGELSLTGTTKGGVPASLVITGLRLRAFL